MFISDEEKRKIMEELARGNPDMLIQESSLNLSQGEQELNDNARAGDGMPMPDSKSHNTQEKPDNDSALLSDDNPKVLSQDIIRLLGERLVVDRSKRKVGEVIVRKEIVTRMIQVPVRYEKLIVEQVSPERKQLAEIDLGQEEVIGIELLEKARFESEIARLDDLA